mmetsp:Transcript_28197/g.90141  ORF Transcript_28197/g.90141 Transcript_28197/m.90141 type:complete len:101 (+) Transcript_28197:772-1074(+)
MSIPCLCLRYACAYPNDYACALSNASTIPNTGGCRNPSLQVLKDDDSDNKFAFFEVYASAEAVAYHKEQDHYKLWSEFKASGGVASQEVQKMTAANFTQK